MQAPPGLIPDAPVPGCECWYRLLTNTDYVTREGTVHYQALKGKVFKAPQERKPWAHELSGQLASLADIRNEAEVAVQRIHEGYIQRGQTIPSKMLFTGVACALARELRTVIADIRPTDIVYSPLPTDRAHSNFVTYQTASDEDLDPVRHWLMKTLRVIKPQDIEVRIASCGQASG